MEGVDEGASHSLPWERNSGARRRLGPREEAGEGGGAIDSGGVCSECQENRGAATKLVAGGASDAVFRGKEAGVESVHVTRKSDHGGPCLGVSYSSRGGVGCDRQPGRSARSVGGHREWKVGR